MLSHASCNTAVPPSTVEITHNINVRIIWTMSCQDHSSMSSIFLQTNPMLSLRDRLCNLRVLHSFEDAALFV